MSVLDADAACLGSYNAHVCMIRVAGTVFKGAQAQGLAHFARQDSLMHPARRLAPDRWAKERHGSKRRKTDWNEKAGLTGGLLVAALVIAALLWMHQRLGVKERLMTIEETQRRDVPAGE